MTHKEKVLALLSDGEWHLHTEGYRLGVMLHSRVSDLRKDYVVECRRSSDGYEYRLVGSLSDVTPSPATGMPVVGVASLSDSGSGTDGSAPSESLVHPDQLALTVAA